MTPSSFLEWDAEGDLSELFRFSNDFPAPLEADDECRHGRLPGDRSPACGCWADLEVVA